MRPKRNAPNALFCGGKSARIADGLIDPPSKEKREKDPFWKSVRSGEIVLRGCCMGPWKWSCKQCMHEWPDKWED